MSQVDVTEAAAELVRDLTERNGPVMFHQSGGCCDGSSPMCYPEGEFITAEADIHLGNLDAGLPKPIEVWMSKAQFEYWKHTHLTIDVVAGRGPASRWSRPPGSGSSSGRGCSATTSRPR